MADVLALAIAPDARDKAVQRTLVILAEMRQAHISAETLLIYGRALRAYEAVDLRAALEHYRRTPREQGETAMPDLPSLEGTVRACRGARLRQAAEAKAVADEKAEREQYEREKASGTHEPDPATRDTMNRLARILDGRKDGQGGTMSLSSALAKGDAEREMNTRQRAAEARQVAVAASAEPCRKCGFWATMTPEELRRLADLREARIAEEMTTESEVAA